MEIKILGTGCPNCKTLEKQTLNALAELKIDADVEKVEDIVKIMSYGIMKTPGIVIDGKVVLYGRLPSMVELKEIILKHQ
ncbi:MAG: thioredoxin family protein [Bacteroidota bacterium]